VALLKAERARMERAAAAMEGVEVVPGAANFFLLRTPLASSELVARLTEHGVWVRDVSMYPGLGGGEGAPGWVRVSAGAEAENRAFEVALQTVLAAAGVPAG
jgi:histidinol-phosphate aminotransferase